MIYVLRISFGLILWMVLGSSCYSMVPKAKLVVTVVEELSNTLTPVRVKITSKTGKVAVLPSEAIRIMYGRNDKPERYGYQPDSSFYVDGKFSLELDEGEYRIYLSKGMEFLDQTHTLNLKSGENIVKKFIMNRWINMSDLEWYSADDHIHIRRSPRENPYILKWIEAEDINVGVLLQMGDFWATYFSQYAFGNKGVYREGENILSSGQEEPRTHEIGHTIALVADDFVRFEDEYYNYDRVFDKVHELNGITGYAHQGMSFHGHVGMTMDVLDGKVDFLELLQFCVDGGPLLTQNYYHFLDLGYKLTATAGSDFPWCGNGPRFGTEGAAWNSRIGDVRFYTYSSGLFSYESWKENVKLGHTFVTSGPMINFNIDGYKPGDQLDLKDKGSVFVKAEAFGHSNQVPLTKIEIVAHGRVIREVTLEDPNQSREHMSINFNLEIDKGVWIAARCFAGPAQVAHTTPVYITMNGKGFHNPETLSDYLALNKKYLNELEAELDKPSEKAEMRAWIHKKKLKTRIARSRAIIEKLKNR